MAHFAAFLAQWSTRPRFVSPRGYQTMPYEVVIYEIWKFNLCTAAPMTFLVLPNWTLLLWDSFSHRLSSLNTLKSLLLSCFIAVLQTKPLFPEISKSLLLPNTHTYLLFHSFHLHSTSVISSLLSVSLTLCVLVLPCLSFF